VRSTDAGLPLLQLLLRVGVRCILQLHVRCVYLHIQMQLRILLQLRHRHYLQQ
jgi:hypothetical protein